MQLLTFRIGAHLLALPAQNVTSVGREAGAAATDGTAVLDLSALIDHGGQRPDRPPVIRCQDGTRTVEMLVDRILGLEHCADGDIRPWPGLLGHLALFGGTALIGGRVFQLLDVPALMKRGKGRRR
ncbi:MAG: chemotaxis protein CheW [Candidatus Edwardsbacteria bacterium]|nr:chemotaxis protein CheW [Candidatus Edwardsbacteria bacterium]